MLEKMSFFSCNYTNSANLIKKWPKVILKKLNEFKMNVGSKICNEKKSIE